MHVLLLKLTDTCNTPGKGKNSNPVTKGISKDAEIDT